MKVSESTIEGLGSFLKEHVEADVVSTVARRLGISAEEALALYFGSELPELVESGKYGVQYLSPEYLADEVLRSANMDE